MSDSLQTMRLRAHIAAVRKMREAKQLPVDLSPQSTASRLRPTTRLSPVGVDAVSAAVATMPQFYPQPQPFADPRPASSTSRPDAITASWPPPGRLTLFTVAVFVAAAIGVLTAGRVGQRGVEMATPTSAWRDGVGR